MRLTLANETWAEAASVASVQKLEDLGHRSTRFPLPWWLQHPRGSERSSHNKTFQATQDRDAV